MYEPFDQGRVEVICGPMFSGKSTELIRRLKRAEIAGQKVQVFKPDLDIRWDTQKVTTHDKKEFDAIPVSSSADILKLLHPHTVVVGVDEAQFFDADIVSVVQTLANRGIRVVLAGLDMDFRGQPFGPMPTLMAIAETIDKLTAICMVCGAPATRCQRLTDSKEVVSVGASKEYEARCRKHHRY